MSDLISRQAAIDALTHEWDGMVTSVFDVVKALPSAQPIIRCNDCKWYQESEHLSPNKFCFRLKDRDGNRVGYNFADNDFCSRAERRTDERSDIETSGD